MNRDQLNKVCVITGGGSGMGLAAAKIIGQDHKILIAGRTVDKLQDAVKELQDLGIEVVAKACDVSNRESVFDLARYASSLGKVQICIHSAGVSPSMSKTNEIMKINALGTIYIHEAFYEVMDEGACLIDVSSMAGHMIPKMMVPKKSYRYARTDADRFLGRMKKRNMWIPKKHRAGFAYGLSKNFVTWFAKTDANRFAKKGIRVLSVSPGFFETPMGEAEKDGFEMFVHQCAIKRYGKVEEIAYLFKYLASEKLSYLTGVDILCDGGCIASTLQ